MDKWTELRLTAAGASPLCPREHNVGATAKALGIKGFLEPVVQRADGSRGPTGPEAAGGGAVPSGRLDNAMPSGASVTSVTA